MTESIEDIFDKFFDGDNSNNSDQQETDMEKVDGLGGDKIDSFTKGADLRTSLSLAPSEARDGCNKRFIIERPATCQMCKGKGTESDTGSKSCDGCDGTGLYGPTKRNIDISIPSGTSDGQIFQVQDEGVPDPGSGGDDGDLYVEVSVSDKRDDSEDDSIDEGFFTNLREEADEDDEQTLKDLKTQLSIGLEEAYEGVKKQLTITRPETCPNCSGKGHPSDADARTCPECEGRGQVTSVQRTPMGRVQQTTTCSECEGEGILYERTCSTCGGDGVVRREASLSVNVPAGIKEGQTLRMAGEGIQNSDGQDSDLLIEVDIEKPDSFIRDGSDLYREVSVSRTRLDSGGTIELEGIENTITLDLPPNTSDGAVFELSGRGMPNLRGQGRGDLYVSVRLRGRGRERSQSVNPPDEIPAAPIDTAAYDSLSMGEQIGSGGQANVVQATVETDDSETPVALKQPQLDGTIHAETVERILDEAKTWDNLDDHDHIVDLIDYGSEPIPWIAMEYMDAGHLGERVGDLPVPQALWTAITVTDAVNHAHHRGVAHLDLKPTNVLFREVEGSWDPPKVADWGLSKHLLDRSQNIEGYSPQYAAPEQFDDASGEPDHQTDVYQLGAVFYELFTGRPPFDKTTPLADRIDGPPPDPQSIADIPDGVADVVTTAMAPNRSDRYDSVLYVRDWLREEYES